MFCNEAKQKKHGIITNPVSQQIICVKEGFGSDFELKPLLQSKDFQPKDLVKIEELVQSVESAIVQWKEKVKKTTSIEFHREVNPLKAREIDRKVGSYNNPKKMISLKPKGVFGIKNLGNTCFFNATMQCMNSWNHFTHHYKVHKKTFDSYEPFLTRKNLLLNYIKTNEQIRFWKLECQNFRFPH